MSLVEFTESEMEFSYPEKDCYRIEHSRTYSALGSGVKICECVVRKDDRILFVEAKSSFAYAKEEGRFQKELADIQEKFMNTVQVYIGLLVDRPYSHSDTLPPGLMGDSVRKAPMKCYLIIRRYDGDALQSVDDALNQKLAAFRKTLAIEDIKVISAEKAQKHGLIKAIVS